MATRRPVASTPWADDGGDYARFHILAGTPFYEGSLTYTATGCPCMEFIHEDIRDRLAPEPWVEGVEIVEVWDPPWTNDRITDEGRAKLKELGVGV